MKKYILRIALFALFWSCDTGQKPEDEGGILGKWEQTDYGKIVGGVIDVEPYYEKKTYIFRKNGKGWVYHPEEFQQSFEWDLSDDQLTFTNWKLEAGHYPAVDPGSHYADGDWTVLLLTPDELTVSYWMLPMEWPGETPEEPYEAVMVFKKVK